MAVLTRAYLGELNEVHAMAMRAIQPLIDRVSLRDADAPKPRIDPAVAGEATFVLDRLALHFNGPEVRRVVDSVTRSLAASVDRDLKRIARIDPRALVSDTLIRDFQERNVGLIRTVGEDHVENLKRFFQQSDIRDLSARDVAARIQALTDVDANRARFWAVDQSLKLHANITQTRAQSVGLNRYVWTTSHDERVRDSHRDLDGLAFSFDDPPVTSEDGSQNNPGEDYNCRCTPFLLLDNEDTAADIAEAA
jgi:SPP1 gp7 family putative phage head morphogenesis protein